MITEFFLYHLTSVRVFLSPNTASSNQQLKHNSPEKLTNFRVSEIFHLKNHLEVTIIFVIRHDTTSHNKIIPTVFDYLH